MRFSGRFKGYNLQKFQKDLIAGIVVGVVAIPLGMAFAIARESSLNTGCTLLLWQGFVFLCSGDQNIKLAVRQAPLSRFYLAL